MRIVNKEILKKGNFLTLEEISVEDETGNSRSVERIDKDNAVAIVPYNKSGVYLVVQPRFVVEDKAFIEVPAGTLDIPGENELDCAKRELTEETGLRADKWHRELKITTSPGCVNETVTIYSATALTEGVASPTEGEDINTIFVNWLEVFSMIAYGKITDAKSIVGLQHVFFNYINI